MADKNFTADFSKISSSFRYYIAYILSFGNEWISLREAKYTYKGNDTTAPEYEDMLTRIRMRIVETIARSYLNAKELDKNSKFEITQRSLELYKGSDNNFQYIFVTLDSTIQQLSRKGLREEQALNVIHDILKQYAYANEDILGKNHGSLRTGTQELKGDFLKHILSFTHNNIIDILETAILRNDTSYSEFTATKNSLDEKLGVVRFLEDKPINPISQTNQPTILSLHSAKAITKNTELDTRSNQSNTIESNDSSNVVTQQTNKLNMG